MSGVLLRGVSLQNASWNKSKKHLTVSGSNQQIEPESIPLVHLNPVDKNRYEKENKDKTYFSCPLYLSGEDDQLSADYIVTHLDLPTECDVSLLREKNVHLTCKL